jgi:hypothetical protein
MKVKKSFFLKSFLIGILLITIFIRESKTQTNIDVTDDSIQARIDLVDVFNKVTKRDTTKAAKHDNRKVFFSLMPLSGGSSGEGTTISAISASFHLGNPETTNLSNVTFYPSTNFASRFQFRIIPNIWLSNNSWFIPGKIEIAYMEQKTYGLGANSSKDSLNIISYNLMRFYFSINREIFTHYFAGIGYIFDDFYNIDQGWDKLYPSSFELYGYGTSSRALSSGLTFNLFYDSRKNIVNPLSGTYASAVLRINSQILGSDYDWQSFYFDARKYISFSKVRHRTLAIWGLYIATWGEIPYLDLPGTSLDYSGMSGRGYWPARYRGKQMIYGETEYRFDITNNGLWGGVIFVNAQSYTEPDTEKFKYIKPAIGTGLRLKFNKYSDSNMTFDIAAGIKSFNWYISLNEAF